MADMTSNMRDYHGFFYHKVEEVSTTVTMDQVRLRFIELLEYLLIACPSNRERSIAITQLQTALMFATSSLAQSGKLVVPDGFDYPTQDDGGA